MQAIYHRPVAATLQESTAVCPASDDSSDDEPLIKQKKPAAKDKKESAPPKSDGSEHRNSESNTGDDSDNGPLVKTSKPSSRSARKKKSPEMKKKPVGRKKKGPSDRDESSDDEPLSEIVKRLPSKRKRKAVVLSHKASPVLQSKRNAGRKSVNYAEASSEHSSDDDQVIEIKRKKGSPKEREDSSKRPKSAEQKSLKDSSSSDSCSDEDDVPLVSLISKKKPAKKSMKMSQKLRGRPPKESQGICDEDDSSDDDALVNRSDQRTKSKTKRKNHEKTWKDVPSSISDEEAVIKAAEHAEVTRMVKISLQRCDGEDKESTGPITSTPEEEPIEDKSTAENSQKSSEEE
ncbi:hypothetical protein ATANTOWER_019372 [Ataeniobius toweri]|uniref:Uncharacterized protein n=1 Tax=Ataeniobius toweri TaxID=208326 RepID=A0ABU7BQJ1_9TELE|nr:hypothetical protein [Ataeniobius toweri]